MAKVIKIGAEWCMPCKVLGKALDKFDKCEIAKYDVEEDDEVVEKYGVRNIPVTILLDDNENEVKRWVGLFNVDEITDELRKLGKYV